VWNRLIIIALLFCSTVGFSPYGNEWIDYNQQYFSFKVFKNGVYKLDYNQLQLAGVPVDFIAPENFQIFGFEKQQEIWIQGGGDGSFDPGDFIVFY